MIKLLFIIDVQSTLCPNHCTVIWCFLCVNSVGSCTSVYVRVSRMYCIIQAIHKHIYIQDKYIFKSTHQLHSR